MPVKPIPKRRVSNPPPRPTEMLDVQGAAALLTVSADTVYDLFAKGELPGRQGRAQMDHHQGRRGLRTRPATTAWCGPWSAATWVLVPDR
jgi:hypothetical protein